jgi:hypothetical protein
LAFGASADPAFRQFFSGDNGCRVWLDEAKGSRIAGRQRAKFADLQVDEKAARRRSEFVHLWVAGNARMNSF